MFNRRSRLGHFGMFHAVGLAGITALLGAGTLLVIRRRSSKRAIAADAKHVKQAGQAKLAGAKRQIKSAKARTKSNPTKSNHANHARPVGSA